MVGMISGGISPSSSPSSSSSAVVATSPHQVPQEPPAVLLQERQSRLSSSHSEIDPTGVTSINDLPFVIVEDEPSDVVIEEEVADATEGVFH